MRAVGLDVPLLSGPFSSDTVEAYASVPPEPNLPEFTWSLPSAVAPRSEKQY